MIKFIFARFSQRWNSVKKFKSKFENSNRIYHNKLKLCIHKINNAMLNKLNIFNKYNQTNPLHYWTGLLFISILLIFADSIIVTQFNSTLKMYLQIAFCLFIPGTFAITTSLAGLLLLMMSNKRLIKNINDNHITCETNCMISMMIITLSSNILITSGSYDLCQSLIHPGYRDLASIFDKTNQVYLVIAVLTLFCSKYSSIFLKAVNKFKV